MAKALVNRCAQSELETRPWAFRRTNAVLSTTAPKTAGTADVAQGSSVVTGAATAFDSTDVGKQFRVGAGDSAVGLFIVQSVQSATQLTLTSPYPGSSLAAQPYFLFQQYYTVTGADQVLSVQGGNQVDLAETTHEAMNRQDPLRQASSNPPTSWAPKGRSSIDDAQIEFWPIASAAIPFVVEYLIRFVVMTNDNDQCIAPGAVVENKALWDACMACFSETGDPRWFQAAQGFQELYSKELEDAIRADERRYGIQPQIRMSGGNQPGIDLTYNHDFGIIPED